MKRAEEPISLILDKTGAVTTAQGPWRAFFIMIFALATRRRKWPIFFLIMLCGGGTKWYGLW